MKEPVKIVILIACLGALFVLYRDRIFVEAQVNTIPADAHWPPILGEAFPDLKLIDHRGNTINLAQFTGKVVIVEPIGMTCPACNAWSGSGKHGAFHGKTPKGTQAFEDFFSEYTKGTNLQSEDIVFVQLLLYNLKMETPKSSEAKLWAEHYKFVNKPNMFVAVPRSDIRNKVSYDMIPGFFLIDKDFILRSDATGHHPKNSIFRHLLTMVPELILDVKSDAIMNLKLGI